MQLPDEYQNDPQGRDKWHRSHKEEEAKQLIEKIFKLKKKRLKTYRIKTNNQEL